MRILIADDHDLIRDGLRPFLEELDETVEIADAATFNDVCELIKKPAVFDLILLDVNMPGMAGARSIGEIVGNAGDAKVVMLSGHFERSNIEMAISEGAAGFIPKTMSGQRMLNAIRLVLGGEVFVPMEILHEQDADETNSSAIAGGVLARLTPREMEILGGVISGQTNKEIAREKDLEEITVKVHLRNVYKKIGANNRADAVRIALENGWSG